MESGFFNPWFKVKGGTKIEINREAMQEAQSCFGYFALMSNEIKDAREALLLYRNRDVVEKQDSHRSRNTQQADSDIQKYGSQTSHRCPIIVRSFGNLRYKIAPKMA